MRLRNVKNAKQMIDRHPAYIININRDKTYHLNNAFQVKQPLAIEIGSGKGQFIHTMAKKTPETNFLAIEKQDSVILRALEKVLVEPLKNLYLVRMDAEKIVDCVAPGSVDTIYLNFSDPWPKVRHEKRRLTHPEFLDRYKTMLNKHGTLVFKTDNRAFFEYSILTMQQYGLLFKALSLNVHEANDPDNIMTEFEEKFSKHGPIYKVIATFKEA